MKYLPLNQEFVMALAFLIGFLGLFGQAYISYNNSIQNKWFYYPLGIGLNAVGAFLWFYIAKTTSGKVTFIASMMWDGMAAAAFMILPLLLFNVKLTEVNLIGLLFGILGLILMKIGG